MKEEYLMVVLAVFFFLFVDFASAGSVGLIENSTWQENIRSSSISHVGVVSGDIDNDGDLDLISIGCESTSSSSCDIVDNTYVWINNGTTFFNSSTWQQNLSDVGAGSLALGDIDNDGDLDLIVSGNEAPYTSIYTNNGTTFNVNLAWQSQVTGENGAASYSIALGDIDNDGDLDLIFPGMSSNKVIYLNNGTSFVNCSSTWGIEIIDDTSKISTGLIDFDNDGDLDLNIMGEDSARTYLNNGTSFVNDVSWGISGGDEASIAWGDIDNDGDFDEILSTFSTIRFGINDGTGFPLDSSWNYNTLLGTLAWGSMMLGDYDNNGYLDLVNAGSSGGAQLQIGENNGTTFIRDLIAEGNLTGMRDGQILWGDVDNDGDLDLIDIRSWKVYISNASLITPNSAPTPPASFSSSYDNREIRLGWGNGSDAETTSNGLYYNLMVGNSTTNHTIISGVYGGYGDATRGGTTGGYFGNMMQRKNFTLKVDRLSASTTYYWYVQTIDTGLKAGNWSAVQSFSTPADMERPEITLNAPVDGYNSSSYTITFNVIVTDMNLSNVSLYGNWSASGWHLNETNTSGINGTYIFEKNLTAYGDGSYIWMIQAKDNATNIQNSSVRTFTIDTTIPNINIVSPANNTNSTNNNLNVNYTVSDANLAYCWYSNDSYTSNQTITCGQNITTITWAEGQHNVTVWANDSFGNENSSFIRFTIDTIAPDINIIYPVNNTDYTDNTLDINYTVTDANLAYCWYSNDSSSVNVSLGTRGNCTNITSITWADGQHNVTIWANDSFGNLNSSIVEFRTDTIAPNINITSPTNDTNSSDNSLNVNYTVSDANLQACWYSNDSYTSNQTITCGINISVTWSEGQHNVTIYANDTVGNKSSSSVRFTIDTTIPNINIISPVNNTNSSDNSLDINYTVSDAHLQACWYSNDTYSYNETITCGNNITTITWSEGQHNVTVWANDSFGNENSSFIRFTIDTAAPIINLISPANASTWTSSSTVTFSYNVTDVDIANCSLIINNSVDQTDITIDEEVSQSFTKSLSNTAYIWSINCTDYVGYTNFSSTRNLTVSYTPSTEDTGGNGGGTRALSYWTNTYTIKDADFEKGYTKELSIRQRMRVSVNKTSHYIGIINISNESVTVNVTSSPQQAVLFVNQTKKFELTNDSFYDLSVRLNDISKSKANLTIMKIYEEISEIEEKIEEEGEGLGIEEKKKEELDGRKGKLWIWIVVVAGLVVIGIISWFIKFKFSKKKWQK